MWTSFILAPSLQCTHSLLAKATWILYHPCRRAALCPPRKAQSSTTWKTWHSRKRCSKRELLSAKVRLRPSSTSSERTETRFRTWILRKCESTSTSTRNCSTSLRKPSKTLKMVCHRSISLLSTHPLWIIDRLSLTNFGQLRMLQSGPLSARDFSQS